MPRAIAMPAHFGKYYPVSSSEEQDARLRRRFETDLDDAARAPYRFPESYFREIHSRHVYNHAPIAPEERFDQALLDRKPPRGLGDLITMQGVLAVSAPLRELIEALEPGVHQTWPLTIEMPRRKGEAPEFWPDPYYTLVIGRTLETVSRPDTDPSVLRKGLVGIWVTNSHNAQVARKVAVSAAAAAGAHLWREEGARGYHMLISDALHEEMRARGLTSPPRMALKTV